MRANRSMPPSTVIPVLAYEDLGRAIDWRWTFSQTIADVAPEEWGGTTA